MILELCLYCLIGLEYEKIVDEYKELFIEIVELLYILNNVECLMEVICEEFEMVKFFFGDECCIEIIVVLGDINIEDLIV